MTGAPFAVMNAFVANEKEFQTEMKKHGDAWKDVACASLLSLTSARDSVYNAYVPANTNDTRPKEVCYLSIYLSICLSVCLSVYLRASCR